MPANADLTTSLSRLASAQAGEVRAYCRYDEAGNRSEIGYLGGGVAYFTYYNYDERNQLQELTDPHGQTVYYEHDELGREVEKALPNGVTTYHKYDDASQITDIIHLGPSGVLQSLYYAYDAAGRRTRIDREDGTSIYYGYDDADRLTGEDWLDPSDGHIYGFAYEYDDAGNRQKKTFNGEVTYYDYNNLNRLTTERVLGGEATYYTWTADGEMATKQEAAGGTYYTWDVDESLTKIEAPATTLENKYNARMQRVWRREDGEAEWLVYDAQKLVAEATTDGLERYYLSEGGSVYSPLVSQLGSQHWFQFDALGTTLGLTDGSGGLSDTFRYEAFGTSLGRTGTTATPYQYVGGYGYFDEPGVGLEQVWWRWLQQSWGWISLDSLKRLSTYHYANLQPTHFVDIDGRIAEADFIPIIVKPYLVGPVCVGTAWAVLEVLTEFQETQDLLGVDHDKWLHCMATCLITQIAGAACAVGVMALKDLPRPADQRRTHMAADWAGIKAGVRIGTCKAKDVWVECDTACIHAGYFRLFGTKTK